MTNSIAEFETDSKVIFVIGSNTTACHPLIANRIIKAKENGARLIVADPRNIQLTKFADLAVHQRLGTDVALLNGMMHVIIRNDWHAAEYVEKRCEEFEALKKTVASYDPERVEAITGIAARDIEQMAELYATNAPGALLYAMGITQHTTGVDNVKSCCNLAMLCGNLGVPGGGVNPLRGQNNVQGACDMGGLPNVFTGYQPVADPEVREKFASAWNCGELSDTPGMTITDMISAIDEGKIKGLYVIGENPKLSDPDKNHLDHVLKKLDFLVVEDIFLTESAQVADVVFASAALGERQGTFTNTERRCMLTQKAVEPVGNALPDWQIISRFATALGHGMSYDSPEEVFNEMASLTKSYQGMTYDRIGIDGLQWPCLAKDHPGTPYLHKETFTRGKGMFHAIEFKEPAEAACAEYPMMMTTGRMFAHFHTGTMTRVSNSLDTEQKTGYVDINPADAEKLNIASGDMVLLTSRRGEIEAPAQITDSVPPNNVFLPIHFGENPTNTLTSSTAFDPIAKIPEFKVGAVKIEKLIA